MYRVARDLAALIIRFLFPFEVFGAESVPLTGGAIIAANHASLIDPVVIASSISRPIHFMGKAELFRNRLVAQFLNAIYVFPVDRGTADRQAIRYAIDLVKNNSLLGIFPEGTRNKEKENLPLQGGAALVAIKGGVPIIPVVVQGTANLRFRKKIYIYIGEPILIKEGKKATKDEILSINESIYRQFSALLKQESRTR